MRYGLEWEGNEHQFSLDLRSRLRGSGVIATPQALATLVECVRTTGASEILGDSDSILLGLLCAGSYTVDVLEAAGVNPRVLLKLAKQSVNESRGDRVADESCAAQLMHSAAVRYAVECAKECGGTLETSHLMQAAIAPNESMRLSGSHFPLHLRRDAPPQSKIQYELELRAGEFLTYATSWISSNPAATLSRRTSPLSDREIDIIDTSLESDTPLDSDEEFHYVIDALNDWFTKRHLRTVPAQVCLSVINQCDPLLFGPELLLKAGGDIHAVGAGIALAERFSPERDLAGLALFRTGGKFQIGQYTYRNTFAVEPTASHGRQLRRVSLQAVRPVSLIATDVIAQLEHLISRSDLAELEIQRFLVQHPELVKSLGYTRVWPHLCMRLDDGKSMIPDFFVELPGDRGTAILDLKLPDETLAVREPYLRLSSQLIKAAAQLRAYSQYFDDAKRRAEFRQLYGFEPFKPELAVVIGRGHRFKDRFERVEVEHQLPGVRLITYDDLIAYGRTRCLAI